MTFLERCLQCRDIFGVNFDKSYYFDKANFERKNWSIFSGVGDQTLSKVKEMLIKQEQRKA